MRQGVPENQNKPRKAISGAKRAGRFYSTFILLLSLLLAFPPVAVAQSFAVGFAKYQRGDFKGAEQSLVQALSTKPSPAESAKILKILGISQYMLGNRNGAAASFTKALSISPSLRVSAGEVLDESVIAFFEKQRATLASTGKRETPPSRAQAARNPKKNPAPQPAPSKQQTPSRSVASRDGNGATQAKKTVLKVMSNVAGAQISIDGILAGRPGELINTEPGVVPVEVKATGYITKSLSVNITKDRENTINVNLEKIPPPKPKPKPKPAPVAVAATKAAGQSPGNAPGGRTAKSPNPRSSGRGAGNAALTQDGDDLFAPTPKDDLFYDPKTPANAAAPAAGGGADLASEFEREAAAAAAPAMAPGYPAPAAAAAPAAPGYPPPTAAPGNAAPPTYMPPQPVYPYGAPPAYYGGFAPAPMYAAPPVYQPPPAYAPPADPMMDPGMQSAGPQSPGYNDPAPLPDPAYSESDGSGAYSGPNPKRTSNRLVYILPFGIGQFAQKRYVAGLFFAAAEIGLLYGVYHFMTQAAQAKKDGTAIREQCTPIENCDPKLYEEAINTYQEEIKQGNTMVTIGLIGAGVTAFAGAIEALMHAHDPSDSGRSSKKRRKGRPSKRRKYSGFTSISPSPMHLPLSLWDDEGDREEGGFTWDLKISSYRPSGTLLARPYMVGGGAYEGLSGPQDSVSPPSLQPSLLLDVTWTF